MTFLLCLAFSFDFFYEHFYNSTPIRNETVSAIDRANLYRHQKLFHSNRLLRATGHSSRETGGAIRASTRKGRISFKRPLGESIVLLRGFNLAARRGRWVVDLLSGSCQRDRVRVLSRYLPDPMRRTRRDAPSTIHPIDLTRHQARDTSITRVYHEIL